MRKEIRSHGSWGDPKGSLDRLRNRIGEFWDDEIEKRRRKTDKITAQCKAGARSL